MLYYIHINYKIYTLSFTLKFGTYGNGMRVNLKLMPYNFYPVTLLLRKAVQHLGERF